MLIEAVTEGAIVTTAVDLESGGITIPKGIQGTVVHIYPGSQAFEVEFLLDINTEDTYTLVVTVMFNQLELV